MENNSCTVSIEVDQSATVVFNAICNVTSWWSKDFEGNSTGINDEFVIHHPGQHYSKQKVVQLIPYNRITWLVTASELYWLKNNQADWTDTKMDFQITSNGNKTILQFTHEGLVPAKESYDLCNQGWHMIITQWLYHFICTGKPAQEMENAAAIRNKYLEGNIYKL
ncbi:MAG: SRPBCC domain-containing protein [Chitinophagaceae bacterium]